MNKLSIPYIYYYFYSYKMMNIIQSSMRKMYLDPPYEMVAGKFRRKYEYIVEATNTVKQGLQREEPFFVGRFGANELNILRVLDFGTEKEIKKAMLYFCSGAGFFPNDIYLADRFYDIMTSSIRNVDVLGTWSLPLEDYYVNKYTDEKCVVSCLDLLDPKSNPYNPWTAALKDKKVLVIHPFEKTIKKQYFKKRRLLFDNEEMLPEFELETIKAVQTIAGEKDNRFDTWFDALEYMKEEILKRDFDIALIGCGAYGFPLGAFVKSIGKKAVHAGGILQTYFGITGNRWTAVPEGRITRYSNEHWVFPDEEETPGASQIVEDSAYWKGNNSLNPGNWKL